MNRIVWRISTSEWSMLESPVIEKELPCLFSALAQSLASYRIQTLGY